MMLKRLLVFKFTQPISLPKNVVQGCGPCFAAFLLGHGVSPPHPMLPASSAEAQTTAAEELHVEHAESWSVLQVVAFLRQLSLGHLAPQFEENGIDGQMLCELSMEDLMETLGLKPLQARKLMNRLWA
jgi:hypothetical protein